MTTEDAVIVAVMGVMGHRGWGKIWEEVVAKVAGVGCGRVINRR